MLLIPLFEEDKLPDLTAVADLSVAMKTIRKTLLIWETQKDRTNYSELITYINESIKLSKEMPGIK